MNKFVIADGQILYGAFNLFNKNFNSGVFYMEILYEDLEPNTFLFLEIKRNMLWPYAAFLFLNYILILICRCFKDNPMSLEITTPSYTYYTTCDIDVVVVRSVTAGRTGLVNGHFEEVT